MTSRNGPSRRSFLAGRLDAADGPAVAAIGAGCLPFEGVDCQLCRDACAAGAVRFRPVRGGPFVPRIAVDACTGCADCVPACPTGALVLSAAREEADA